jgi:hypothetical protein
VQIGEAMCRRLLISFPHRLCTGGIPDTPVLTQAFSIGRTLAVHRLSTLLPYFYQLLSVKGCFHDA